MSWVQSGDQRGRSSEASVARSDLRSSPLEAMTSISNPVEVTTLNASCDPSDDQAGLRPPAACGRNKASDPSRPDTKAIRSDDGASGESGVRSTGPVRWAGVHPSERTTTAATASQRPRRTKPMHTSMGRATLLANPRFRPFARREDRQRTDVPPGAKGRAPIRSSPSAGRPRSSRLVPTDRVRLPGCKCAVTIGSRDAGQGRITRAGSMNEVFSTILRYSLVASCWLRWLRAMATSSISRRVLTSWARAMCCT